MKRPFLSLLAGSLLVLVSAASQAQSFKISLTGGNWVFQPNSQQGGITSDRGYYRNALLPTEVGAGGYSAFSFGDATAFSFGGATTFADSLAAVRPSSDTFSGGPVRFSFDLTDTGTGISRHFLVEGAFVGLGGAPAPRMMVNGAGFGDSQAAFRADSVTVNGRKTFSDITTSPGGTPGIRSTVWFGAMPVTLWVDHLSLLSAPGNPGSLSAGGFVHAVPIVPEPGAMAFLIGSGVCGTLFVVRRRRRA